MKNSERPEKKGGGRSAGGVRVHIAAPARVAVQGRSKAEHHDNNDAASTKSSPDGNSSDKEDGELDPRDKKILHLQKEIQTMEDEFERELTQLSHKLTNESETALFWQQKHIALEKTWAQMDKELRSLRQEFSTFQQERDSRDRDIKTRISSLMLDRDAFREAYNEACADLKAKEDVVRSLQGQVWGLKSFVSTSSKMDEQVADEAFGEQMQRLGNSLQNWVITNFRRTKIEIDKPNQETKDHLLRLVPTYESLAPTSKIHFIQSLISRLLVETIFEEYFVGLPRDRAESLRNAEKFLGSFGSGESMNSWRSNTLAILRKEAPQKLQAETTAIITLVIETVNGIMNSISDSQSSEPRDQSLRVLVNNAIELSRLLRVQKAIFSVNMPIIEGYQRTVFDTKSMEDISGEDEETLYEREIRCVAFPGLIKSGDENGEKAHLRNVVSKMRVLCAAD